MMEKILLFVLSLMFLMSIACAVVWNERVTFSPGEGYGTYMTVGITLRYDPVAYDSGGAVFTTSAEECIGDEVNVGSGSGGGGEGEWNFEGGVMNSPPIQWVSEERFNQLIAVGPFCTERQPSQYAQCPGDIPLYKVPGLYGIYGANVVCVESVSITGENVYYDERTQSYKFEVEAGGNDMETTSIVKCAAYMKHPSFNVGAIMPYIRENPASGLTRPGLAKQVEPFVVQLSGVSLTIDGEPCEAAPV
jgi:hypothetical protein